MSSQEEWQAKLDEDFPHGALASRPDHIDPDGTRAIYRTAATTVTSIADGGFPVIQIWLDEEFEKDAHLTVLSYEQINDDPVQVLVKTAEGITWRLSDSVPPKVYNSANFKAHREAQRSVSLGQPLNPAIASMVGLD